MSFFEGIEFLEVFNFLPFFIGISLVEDFLVNFEEGGLLNITVVIGFVVLLKEEWFEVDDQFHCVSFSSSDTCVLDNPVFIQKSKFFLKKFLDLRPGRVVLEFFDQIFNILFRLVGFSQGKDGSSI